MNHKNLLLEVYYILKVQRQKDGERYMTLAGVKSYKENKAR